MTLKTTILSIVWVLLPLLLRGQTPATSSAPLFEPEQKVTRALVVGISDYLDPSQKLNYAHRDAILFAEYLKSPWGGNISDENLVLLVNDQATKDAIYTYLYKWLLKEAKPGERAIFYFSGHGDVETETFFEEGFLLAYDTPPNNYVGNAISVDRLNKVIKSLSLKGIDVTVVTDACRSGKLAGEAVNGAMRTAQAMGTKTGDAIKMLSCQADQKSTEDGRFGNGMGAFTYFLLQALYGLADADKDKAITVLEVEDYLKRNVPREVRDPRQLPKLDYTDPFLEIVDLSQGIVEFTGWVQNEALLETSGPLLKGGSSSSQKLFELFRTSLEAGSLLGKTETAEFYYSQLQGTELADPATREYLIALQEPAQLAINAYLMADSADLAKRNFKEHVGNFGRVARYLRKAIEINGPEHPLANETEAKALYFEGLDLRLSIKEQNEVDTAIKRALKKQKAAAKLLPEAAYIQNELGLLHAVMQQYTQAVDYFKKAKARAPTWALPYINLCAILSHLEAFDAAEENCRKAKEMKQGNLAPIYINQGAILLEKGKLLDAEEHYWAAIKADQSLWKPFQNMGYLYLEMGLFTQANLMFYEADLRRQHVFFPLFPVEYRHSNLPTNTVLDGIPDSERLPWPDLQRMIEINPNDIEAYMEFARRAFAKRDFTATNYRLHQVTQIDSLYVDVYHKFLELADTLDNQAGKLLYFEKLLQLDNSSDIHNNAIAFYRKLDRKDLLESYALDWEYYGLHNDLLQEYHRWEEVERLALDPTGPKRYDIYYRIWHKVYPDRSDILYKTAVENHFTSNYHLQNVINATDQFGGLAEIYWHLASNKQEEALDIANTIPKNTDEEKKQPLYWQEQDTWELTLAYLKESISLRPEDIDLRTFESDILDELRRMKERLELLGSLYSTGRSDVLEEGDLALLLAFDNQLDSALQLIQKVLDYYPNEKLIEPEILSESGILSLMKEETSAARDLFIRALKLAPMNGDYAYQLARCSAFLGDLDEAKDYLKLAILYDFRYERVFKYDPLLMNLRKEEDFNELLNAYLIDMDQLNTPSRFEYK